ncbi:serine/threonine-protein kinase [Polyangium aurulentum]|uniref:serine/threonine-protein kinase n=1 Tax=Polyangium aurulentum TaxID=2567896 RepID=UPI0010ADADEB|nr:serine/threonine-protein kinase [Polyangium aurulentum]UQA55339.1 serine/threonine protein kinase [Polyangium aurulentum]
MRICPACSREYPDERTHCPEDGIKLVVLDRQAALNAGSLVGQLVDSRYRVERVLGHGGMGTVYACRHVVVGKQLAMKVLRPPRSGQTEEMLARFIREAQTANALKSRHIVETTDFGQLPDGPFYVVMELLEGQDLGRAMRDGRLDFNAIVHVFVQIADTLESVHAHGIVHRDMKPDNVFLVNENGDPLFVKLLDFGIAKVMHGGSSELTEEGVILGTPHYMAPEQARSEGVDHRADIYALGVMMYRAFTGRLPFTAESTIGVITRQVADAPEPPSRHAAMDPRLEALILRCMEKRSEARPQRMAEVAQELRTIARGASGVAWPVPQRVSATPFMTGQQPPGALTGAGSTSPSMRAAMVPESLTNRGVVTSSTGKHVVPVPRRSAARVVVPVVAVLVGGLAAALAFSLVRKGPADPASSPPPVAAAAGGTTAPPPVQPATMTAPAPMPAPTPPEPVASAAATPAPTTTAPKAVTTGRASQTTSRPAATQKTPARKSELRNPFE